MSGNKHQNRVIPFTESELFNEIWVDIKKFPKYKISNLGRVMNKITGYILTPVAAENDDYLHVGLHLNNSKRVNAYVHVLVAEAFLERKTDDLEVNHLDSNRHNNRVTNLEWVTHSDNIKRAFARGNKKPINHPNSIAVKIVETGEIFDSVRKCAEAIDGDKSGILSCLNGEWESYNGLHFTRANSVKIEPSNGKPFLYDFQLEAVKKAFNGAVFNGDVGSGKSRTGLFYFFKEQGGWIDENGYIPMENPKDLYIITTAMKRDKKEWLGELIPFEMYPDPALNRYDNTIVIDSWNNIKKYVDVKDAFFIFDEDKICGTGSWAKSFLQITKNNDWVMLSATTGDNWLDYMTLFIANGFYRNKTEFKREHVEYDPYCRNFPKVKGYRNTGRLIRLRNKILIDMDFKRPTVRHHEDVYCNYDIAKYKDAIRNRWDPFKNEPIQQAAGLCYVLRKIVNSDDSRQMRLLELLEDHPKAIIFYNFDYERDILLNLGYSPGTEIAEWSGHAHQPIPTGDKWVYLTQYIAGCEGWCCITTDTMIFYSQNYSYKVMTQATGRLDRLNTRFVDLHYYHLKSRSGIDLAISKAIKEKKIFNEGRYVEKTTSWFKQPKEEPIVYVDRFSRKKHFL